MDTQNSQAHSEPFSPGTGLSYAGLSRELGGEAPRRHAAWANYMLELLEESVGPATSHSSTLGTTPNRPPCMGYVDNEMITPRKKPLG